MFTNCILYLLVVFLIWGFFAFNVNLGVSDKFFKFFMSQSHPYIFKDLEIKDNSNYSNGYLNYTLWFFYPSWKIIIDMDIKTGVFNLLWHFIDEENGKNSGFVMMDLNIWFYNSSYFGIFIYNMLVYIFQNNRLFVFFNWVEIFQTSISKNRIYIYITNFIVIYLFNLKYIMVIINFINLMTNIYCFIDYLAIAMINNIQKGISIMDTNIANVLMVFMYSSNYSFSSLTLFSTTNNNMLEDNTKPNLQKSPVIITPYSSQKEYMKKMKEKDQGQKTDNLFIIAKRYAESNKPVTAAMINEVQCRTGEKIITDKMVEIMKDAYDNLRFTVPFPMYKEHNAIITNNYPYPTKYEKIGIYIFTNKITKEVGVGSSTNLLQRLCDYRSNPPRATTMIAKNIIEYGPENFTLEIVPVPMELGLNANMVLALEQFLFLHLYPRINLQLIAGSSLGGNNNYFAGANNPMSRIVYVYYKNVLVHTFPTVTRAGQMTNTSYDSMMNHLSKNSYLNSDIRVTGTQIQGITENLMPLEDLKALFEEARTKYYGHWNVKTPMNIYCYYNNTLVHVFDSIDSFSLAISSTKQVCRDILNNPSYFNCFNFSVTPIEGASNNIMSVSEFMKLFIREDNFMKTKVINTHYVYHEGVLVYCFDSKNIASLSFNVSTKTINRYINKNYRNIVIITEKIKNAPVNLISFEALRKIMKILKN